MMLLYYNMIEKFRDHFSNNDVKYFGNDNQDSNRTVIVDFMLVSRFMYRKNKGIIQNFSEREAEHFLTKMKGIPLGPA